MLNNEIKELESYLKTIIKDEKIKMDNTQREFYDTYKIDLLPIEFPYYNENFFLLLQYNNKAIYYNDIEETFGICKIDDSKCTEYAEYFEDLTPTINKFISMIKNNHFNLS